MNSLKVSQSNIVHYFFYWSVVRKLGLHTRISVKASIIEAQEEVIHICGIFEGKGLAHLDSNQEIYNQRGATTHRVVATNLLIRVPRRA